MKVGAIGSVGTITRSAHTLPNKVVQRLNAVRQHIVEAKKNNQKEVAVILRDDKIDRQVIERLSKHFDVSTEASKSIKVNIKL